ncbi:MAG: CTP synthase [Firmicutes bacterium]|nr:CTP synthase [Bacillota bacterium]
MAKFIFVTGGVVSALGKGITAASIGRILKSRGYRVAIQKIDPYINVDPGTMSPLQHGEVFVTEDGAETDLDLGHYERFIDENLTRDHNITTGQVYLSVIEKERRGEYLGGTVQVIPHITNEIKSRIRRVAESSGAEIVIAEVGGTVGDIESLPYLEAIRQMKHDMGRQGVVYIHVTLVPYIEAAGEQKTKPTQHSVKELRSIGIQPDIIICRSEKPLPADMREKIALFCDVEPAAVIENVDVDTIYEVPLMLEAQGVSDLILERLGLPAPGGARADATASGAAPADATAPAGEGLEAWRRIVHAIKHPSRRVEVAIVGKYVALHDAYMSVVEALVHAGAANDARVDIRWIHAEDVEKAEAAELLAGVHGVLVPGGFGDRGIEGKIRTARYARESGVPYFGLCLGMQVAVIEFARHVLGWADAHSTEFDPRTSHPVIDLMPSQAGLVNTGGTMRLGGYECELAPGSLARACYGQPTVVERHRHRFEFNNRYRDDFVRAGLHLSGLWRAGNLVEIVELPQEQHPWFLGTQFHPELRSRPNRPHPLFQAFVAAALAYKASGKGAMLAR